MQTYKLIIAAYMQLKLVSDIMIIIILFHTWMHIYYIYNKNCNTERLAQLICAHACESLIEFFILKQRSVQDLKTYVLAGNLLLGQCEKRLKTAAVHYVRWMLFLKSQWEETVK